MSNTINSAQQALTGFMTGASTASRNIQHAADENYSREVAKFTTGLGGQLIVNIQRMSDSFLTSRLNDAHSSNSEASYAYQATSLIDTLVTGSTMTADGTYENLLQSSMTGMANSWDTLLIDDNPSARQSIIASLDDLTANFNETAGALKQQQSLINNQIGASAEEANKVLVEIAELNDLIEKTQGSASANDLLNRRDALVNDLAQHVDINTRYGENGTVRIELSSGMILVDGEKYREFEVKQGEYGTDMGVYVGGEIVSDNPGILGGRLGAQINVRDNALADAQRKIGLMAATITNAYNEANKAGFTLDGKPGGNLFAEITSGGIPSKENLGDANVNIQIDPAKLTELTDEAYILKKTPTGYELAESVTGKVVGSSVGMPLEANGLVIDIPSGTMMPGDTFTIDPMKDAAQKVEVIGGINDIAIASAVPVIEGDNGNVSNLIAVREDKLMLGGTASISQGLASVFVDIGVNTTTALSQMQTAEAVFNSAQAEWGAYSGVNLEEERVSLLVYEQNYQAASKILESSQKLWSSILDVIN